MKKLESEVYERPESTLEDYGTVREQIGNKGTIGLIERNYSDPSKRLAIVLGYEDGTSRIVTCSKKVSDDFRNGKINLTHITELRILVNEEGVPFISSNAGGVHTFKVSEIKPAKATVSTSFLDDAKVKQLLAASV